MQKVQHYGYATLFAYKIASSGSISIVIDFLFTFLSRYFSLWLNMSYLALEDGTPIFEQMNYRSTILPFNT